MDELTDYSWKNLVVLLLSLMMLLFLGTMGFMLIEGWGWLDAFYMTFITFSTVGFKEVGPMGVWGRLFSMFVIVAGLVVLAMFSANVTSFFVRREILASLRVRKMKHEIHRLKHHTVLCGAGETGKTVVQEFLRTQKPLVVIEKSAAVLRVSRELFPQVYFLEGDATKDEVLHEANIEAASGLITALSDDTDNLFVVISARSLDRELTIVARAVDPHTASKMYKAGATHVISPNLTEGLRMAATVLRPTVVSFLDVMSSDQELGLRLEEVVVTSGSSFHDKSLLDLQIPQRTGLIVIGIKKGRSNGERFQYNPQSTTIVRENDVLIVLGDTDKINKLNQLLRQ